MSITEVIGLIPAAGQATRIAPLPCSKELFPIGFHSSGEAQDRRPKAVSQYLLEAMRSAGVCKVFLVLRAGKWDIPAYYGDGAQMGMNLAYLLMGHPFGTPYTLNQAYPFVQDKVVALGFPDIIIQPEDVFTPLFDRLTSSQAEVVLGLFPTDRPQKVDMVELDKQGQIHSIVIKPLETTLRYTWLTAVWTPIFTQFMHDFLIASQPEDNPQQLLGDKHKNIRELFVGDVIQAAIEQGLRVEGVPFPDGSYLDIGTPDDLAKAISIYTYEN
jgi:glucose-1-phosphate thymidylyltransferase